MDVAQPSGGATPISVNECKQDHWNWVHLVTGSLELVTGSLELGAIGDSTCEERPVNQLSASEDGKRLSSHAAPDV
jgi:hypothetical protein